MKKTLISILLLSLAGGCGDRADLWTSALNVMGPYKAAESVWWVDTSRGVAAALSPAGANPTVQTVSVRRRASFIIPSPQKKRLLMLSAGKEAIYKGQQAEEPGLSLLEKDKEGRPVVARFYPLPRAFNRLAVSEEGRFAVAYHGSSSGSGVFQNPNEVALLDLSKKHASDNPSFRTLRTFGSTPLGVVFSPQMAIPAPSGTKRNLAIILATNQLTLLDMSHTERAEITVPLAQLGTNATIQPQEVLFSAATGSIFVRAHGSADVYALTLMAKTPKTPQENDFSPLINQPSSGKQVQDMMLFSDKSKDLILTANASSDLSVIDAETSQHALIPVGDHVDTILPVPESNPTMALIYSRAKPRSRIHFLKLADLGARLVQNLTSRNLAQPVHQLVATPGGKQALVVHNHQRTVISVLDLAGAHNTISPIQGQLALGSYDFTTSSYLVGVSSGLAELGLINLTNLHPHNLRLDHNPRKVMAVGDAIVVDHGAAQGLVTVIPSPQATRGQCRVLWGFLFNGIFDHKLED